MRARITGIVLCIAIIAIGWKLLDLSRRNIETQTRISKLKSDLATIEEQGAALERMGQLIEGDYFVEREARLKYGMQKPGEHVVILKNETTSIQNTSKMIGEATDNNNDDGSAKSSMIMSNTKRWLDYFFSDKKQTSD